MLRGLLRHISYTAVAILFVNAFIQCLESAIGYSERVHIVFQIIKVILLIAAIAISAVLFTRRCRKKSESSNECIAEDRRTTSDVMQYHWNAKRQKDPDEYDTEISTDEELDNDEEIDGEEISTEEELQAFIRNHRVIDQFSVKVKGVTYRNDDGTSRQEILSCCYSGQRVGFRRYTYNGSPAFAVVTDYGEIGNLPREIAENLDYAYGPNAYISGTIGEMIGGYDGLNYGCVLDICICR